MMLLRQTTVVVTTCKWLGWNYTVVRTDDG